MELEKCENMFGLQEFVHGDRFREIRESRSTYLSSFERSSPTTTSSMPTTFLCLQSFNI
jgi:hypothetical protein